MASSYNGWTASPSPAAIGINTSFKVLGASFPGGIKSGDVEKVFQHLIQRLHNEVEPMMTDPGTGKIGYGCWGYTYKQNVNNPSTLSCHASGTAIDYNAPKHPNGTSTTSSGGGGWTGAQYKKIQQILAEMGGVVRWLSGNDPMHFEIKGTSAQVAAVAARLSGGTLPAPGTPNTPEPEDWWDTVDEARAKQLMKEAVEEALGRGGKVEGLFVTDVLNAIWKQGQSTESLVKAITADPKIPYGAVIYQDGGGLWLSEGGESAAIPDEKTLRGVESRLSEQGVKVLYWGGGDVDLPGAFGRRDGVIPGPDADQVKPLTYTVVSGDTFIRIAGKLGVTEDALAAANPQVTNRAALDIGQVLNIPK